MTLGFVMAAAIAFGSPQQNVREQGIHIEHVRGNVYLIGRAGGNIAVSVGPDGALLVDTGAAPMTDEILAAIQQIGRAQLNNRSGLPTKIRFIINTSIDPDHTGGNPGIARSGVFDPVPGGERIIAHEKLLLRMTEATGDNPPPGMPTETYFTPFYKLGNLFNGEGIQVIHMPAAHTDGDSIVWFRGSDVISVGDLIRTTEYPIIDVEKGGSIQGMIDALNSILDLAFPGFRGQGGTVMVPGHGYLLYSINVGYYRDMVTIARDRIQDLVKKGMTLEQVIAAKPLADYDPVYGRTPGSSERFVESIYRSLTRTR